MSSFLAFLVSVQYHPKHLQLGTMAASLVSSCPSLLLPVGHNGSPWQENRDSVQTMSLLQSDYSFHPLSNIFSCLPKWTVEHLEDIAC